MDHSATCRPIVTSALSVPSTLHKKTAAIHLGFPHLPRASSNLPPFLVQFSVFSYIICVSSSVSCSVAGCRGGRKLRTVFDPTCAHSPNVPNRPSCGRAGVALPISLCNATGMAGPPGLGSEQARRGPTLPVGGVAEGPDSHHPPQPRANMR